MPIFALLTLGPAAALALGALLGGAWPWVALLSMTGLTFVIDRHGGAALPPLEETRQARRLSLALGLLHFPLLGLAVLHLAGATGATGTERAILFLAFGIFFGQISNSNAHELIHGGARPLRRLGEAIYASLLFGHHASAHLLVHHVHVGTGDDPNTARRGESVYRFALRAWTGSFRAGLRAESLRSARTGRRHPYWRYALLTALALGGALALAGLAGVVALLAISLYAQFQLLLSDYVQHYGLTRPMRPDGRPVPLGPEHSWNAPHRASGAMTLNAPRHSDHHLSPRRPFEALRLEPGRMPVLPHSLPVMAVIALVPPLWRRVMDPRLDRLTTRPGTTREQAEATAGGNPAPATAP
ncbi:alkane 1-monooxygenase [Aquicoccus sp. SCR17]|nr:alkane 1-monooxygenase [Carideicomes alvinocaridis]